MRLHGILSESKNEHGGINPAPSQTGKFKHADLITLPPEVTGTNCSNCRYVSTYQGKNVCLHEDLHGVEVTERMCCKYWDHPQVQRDWKPD